MARPATTDPGEESIRRILFEIKVLSFQSPSDEAMAERVRTRILASHDDDVKRFVASLEPVRPTRPWGQVFIGIGELILAAFLTVAGFVTIVPAILGLRSPDEIPRYVGDLVSGVSPAGLSDPVVLAMDFGVALFLLLAALYTLRQAGGRLRSRAAHEHS